MIVRLPSYPCEGKTSVKSERKSGAFNWASCRRKASTLACSTLAPLQALPVCCAVHPLRQEHRHGKVGRFDLAWQVPGAIFVVISRERHTEECSLLAKPVRLTHVHPPTR